MRNKSLIVIIILSLLIGCSGNSDKELFDKAQELIKSENYSDAIVEYEKIVKEFPKSEIAPKSLFEIAKIYQGQVLKNLKPVESLKKSVDNYKLIYNDYPNSKEAESAMFMAAFILANELQDITSAKEMYELFLAKYPSGDLADDAKVELENLGKTPEEILQEKLQTEPKNEPAI